MVIAMNIVLFEDNAVENIYPITTGRAAYEITCASYRLIDFARMISANTRSVVRDHLKPVQAVTDRSLTDPLDVGEPWTLILNGRLVPTIKNFEAIKKLSLTDKPVLLTQGTSIVAAVVATKQLTERWNTTSTYQFTQTVESLFSGMDNSNGAAPEALMPLFQYPHDVVRYNLETFTDNLNFRIAKENYSEIKDGLFVAKNATIDPTVSVHAKNGPIILDEDASIGPFSFINGPAYLGPKARVIEHAAIKDAVSIGHTTKIGGEVEASVIEPFTNKQHHGFLGHSYLGSWINLGAGTCNSDLKNTYGEVKMEYRGQKVSTGMQFIGCIVGDYAKSAINTGIFTGKLIGTCSMVYGFVTTNVPSFVNYARSFGQVTELPPSVMAATQYRMFSRRNVQQRPCDIQLLHDMYELTRHERQLAEEPLVF